MNESDPRERILRNAVRCVHCNTVIESEHNRDFKRCQCGAVAVDGGHVSLNRAGRPEDFEELAILERRL